MKHFSLIILAVILFSCANKPKDLPVLDLAATINKQSPDTFTWNSIAEHISYTSIETRPDALLSQSVYISYIGDDSYCLVDNSMGSIFLTDKNGSIISSLARRGRGPGEYTNIAYVHVDESDSTIQVFDITGANKHIVYDLTGNLIKETSLTDRVIGFPIRMTKNYFVMRGNMHKTTDYKVYITDKDLNVGKGLFPLGPVSSGFERMVLLNQFSANINQDMAIVNFAQQDTVFSITDQGAAPLFILNKGAYRLPEESGKSFQDPSVPYIQNVSLAILPKHYLIRYMLSGTLFDEVWGRADNRLVARFSIENGEAGYPLVLPSGKTIRVPQSSVSGNTVGLLVPAYQLVGEIEGIREDDNPVIVVVDLKK